MHKSTNQIAIFKVTLFLLSVFQFSFLNAQTPDQSGIASINDTKIYYEIAGQGHPLVLIHGGAVDNRAFDDQFYVFAEHFKQFGLTCVVQDNPAIETKHSRIRKMSINY